MKVLVAAPSRNFRHALKPHGLVDCGRTPRAADEDLKAIADAFVIGDSRVFDQDPRFGLIVLSEIASHALSPAVNDPGTAIAVVHTSLRLLIIWHQCVEAEGAGPREVTYDRVAVPELALTDVFEDAFAAIARDGAGTVEVVVRLLKALEALAMMNDPAFKQAAIAQAKVTLDRAQQALPLPADLETVRELASFTRLDDQ